MHFDDFERNLMSIHKFGQEVVMRLRTMIDRYNRDWVGFCKTGEFMTYIPTTLLISLILFQSIIAKGETSHVVPPLWFIASGEFENTKLEPSREISELVKTETYQSDVIEDDDTMTWASFSDIDDDLYIVFDDRRVVRHNLTSSAESWSYEHPNYLTSVTLSQDRKWIVTGSENGTITVIKGSSGNIVTRFRTSCLGGCTALALSEDGSHVVIGDGNGYASIYEFSSGIEIWKQKIHKWPVRQLILKETIGKTILVSSDHSEIVLWEPGKSMPINRLTKTIKDGYSEFWVSDMNHFSGTNYFVIGGYHFAYLANAQTGSIDRKFVGPDRGVLNASITPDGTQVSAMSRDNVLYTWDTESGDLVDEYWAKSTLLSMFINISFSMDGKKIAVASNDPVFAIPPRLLNRIRIYEKP